jgi:ParE toxin of type II toxin-antitoxin system, parDE
MKIRLFSIAQKELDSAIEFYDAQRQGLGNDFLSEVLEAFDRIRNFPFAWPPFHKNTRRCIVSRFPYGIIYFMEENVVLVVAISHLHREPEYWIGRI